MAVIRKKETREVPSISTASLPDVVFMLIFFFMVSTSMREREILVSARLPQASEVEKLEKKSLVSYIYIGAPIKPLQSRFGSSPRIQLNDSFRSVEDIGAFIASERASLSEGDRGRMTVAIRADADTPMGLISDIKQELRRANALNISYTALKPGER